MDFRLFSATISNMESAHLIAFAFPFLMRYEHYSLMNDSSLVFQILDDFGAKSVKLQN